MTHSPIIETLAPLFIAKQDVIEQWFADAFANTPPLFYSSVDIRHSGQKLAPVDTNVFPAGFNNLTEAGKKRAIASAKHFLETYHPGTRRIVIVPENHTRNGFYLDNVAVILEIIEGTGCEAVIGSSSEEVTEPQSLVGASGKPLTLMPLVVKNGQLQTTDGFIPDLVLTNNDFTTGAPPVLANIHQTVIPPLGLGWYQRRKTSHFGTYNDIAFRFAQSIGIDPWLISTIFHQCGVINFKESTGTECVAMGVDKVLHRIQSKYNEYGITETPYVFIKSNRGTYGMGIMTARSGEEVLSMNKKIRNKMMTIKGGELNTEVIIQEGVPTIDTVNGQTAEHMLYLVAGKPADCIYRINDSRDAYGNLNASGMHFQAIADPKDSALCPVVGTIARLASAAAAWECYEASYQI
ncbi:MAG: putative glutamate--cysteine ligase [Rickettsiales bacterium]|jgi:glutamate--cysteine ligase|nr:putative glutamate--cysteine ligase [Rickettsiales bacterium]